MTNPEKVKKCTFCHNKADEIYDIMGSLHVCMKCKRLVKILFKEFIKKDLIRSRGEFKQEVIREVKLGILKYFADADLRVEYPTGKKYRIVDKIRKK